MTEILGDSAVAFVGPCRVEVADMVDLEDVRRRAGIYSPRMVHVIVEHFGLTLREAVLRQRLLGRLAGDLLLDAGVSPRTRGDDLFVEDRKASVSIATCSPVSALMHFGVNVETQGTPVPTWGLSEARIPAEEFGERLIGAYAAEMDDVHRAMAKVRGVP